MIPRPATLLHRSIGLGRATALVVGTIIGASIFVQPSEITGQVPSTTGVFLVWAAAGVLTLFGALVTAELSSAFPKSGGVYVFLREAFSPAVGFLWGWGMFWSMHSGIIAAIAMVFARYVGYFVPLTDVAIRSVAIGSIVVLSAVNYIGVRHGSALQTAFTVGKVAAVTLIIVVGFVLGSPPEPSLDVDRDTLRADPSTGGFEAFGIAMIAGLFAFGGWHMVTYTAEETDTPTTTIPRALLAGIAIVTLCYIGLNAVYLYVLPFETVATSTRVAADAADAVMGTGGGAFMSALVIFSTFGALSGIVLSGPRVYFSMARDGLLFQRLGEVHPRFRTPHRAIILQAVVSSILVATGTYRALFTRVIYTEWIFFSLLAVGLFTLRRRPEYAPRYRVWGFPFVPVVFVLASGAIVLNQIISDPGESAVGLLLVAVGLPVYYLWAGKRRPTSGAQRAND